DYVLLTQDQRGVPTLPSFLDRDSSWAMVFDDDAAVLYVRRASMPAVAARFGYAVMRGSDLGMNEALSACSRQPAFRATLRREARRQRASSPYSVRAETLLGVLAAMDGEVDSARVHFRNALEIDLMAPRVREKLGLIALQQGDLDEAARDFRSEYSLNGWTRGYDFRMGQLYAARGDMKRARAAYRKELERQPMNA